MVPAHVAVRRNRVSNIDTDRLRRRRYHLVLLLKQFTRMIEHRIDMVHRAAELVAIENELIARNELDPAKRVSRPGGRVVVSFSGAAA